VGNFYLCRFCSEKSKFKKLNFKNKRHYEESFYILIMELFVKFLVDYFFGKILDLMVRTIWAWLCNKYKNYKKNFSKREDTTFKAQLQISERTKRKLDFIA